MASPPRCGRSRVRFPPGRARSSEPPLRSGRGRDLVADVMASGRPASGGRRGAGRLDAGRAPTLGGSQPNPGRTCITPQRLGVDVGVAPASADVEAGPAHPDDLAPTDALAGAHLDFGQERVRRADAVTVTDGDVQAPGHGSGEGDHAVGGSSHGGPRRRLVLDSPVPRQPRSRRRPEGIGDRGVDRRRVVDGLDVVDTAARVGAGRGRCAGDRYPRANHRRQQQPARPPDPSPPPGSGPRCGQARGWLSVCT